MRICNSQCLILVMGTQIINLKKKNIKEDSDNKLKKIKLI